MKNEKKYLHFLIMNILKRYSDRAHPMTQAQIAERLAADDLQVNRTTVHRAVSDLIDLQDYTRIHYAGEESEFDSDEDRRPYYTGIYYDHEFSDAELRWLIDGILYSRNVPHEQRDQLIEKLVSLGGPDFQEKNSMRKIRRLSPEEPVNEELFSNIEKLNTAIENRWQIRAVYNYMGPDFKLHPVGGWADWHQLLNPYAMVIRGGFYYLICNKDNYDDLTHYRVDRMTDIIILEEESRKPVQKLASFEKKSWDLQEYMEQNINMAFGEPSRITFIAEARTVPSIIDTFGRGVEFQPLESGQYACVVHVPEYDMRLWALQHCDDVKVVSPESLVEEIRYSLRAAQSKYKDKPTSPSARKKK